MHSCKFPNCTYKTFNRSSIDVHHIVPRSLGGSSKDYNLIELCPNHHRKIYVPEATSGFHSQCFEDSLIIKEYIQSNLGKIILFEDTSGNKIYYDVEKLKVVDF